MSVSNIEDLRLAFDHSEQHELDAVAVLTEVRAVSDDLVSTIDIVVNGEARSSWIATFSGVIENRLAVGDWFMPEVHTTHPLLLDHLDDVAMLYFSKPPTDTSAVLQALAAAHNEVLGDWRPLSRYLHPHMATEVLLAGGNGQLAHGPVTLVNKMAEMTAGRLRTSTVKSNVPRRWNGWESNLDEAGEAVLFLSSETWDSYPSQPTLRSYAIAVSCSIVPAGQTAI